MLDFELQIFWLVSFWTRNFSACQISSRNKDNASQFDLKIFERVRFWVSMKHSSFDFELRKAQSVRFRNKNFSNCQILTENLHSKIDCFSVLIAFTPWKLCILHFLRFFEKQNFESKNVQRVRFWKKITECQILISKKCNASDFELEILQRVRFCVENFWLYQILKWKFSKLSDFELKLSSSSDFELNVWKGVKIWTKNFRLVSFSIENFNEYQIFC